MFGSYGARVLISGSSNHVLPLRGKIGKPIHAIGKFTLLLTMLSCGHAIEACANNIRHTIVAP